MMKFPVENTQRLYLPVAGSTSTAITIFHLKTLPPWSHSTWPSQRAIPSRTRYTSKDKIKLLVSRSTSHHRQVFSSPTFHVLPLVLVKESASLASIYRTRWLVMKTIVISLTLMSLYNLSLCPHSCAHSQLSQSLPPHQCIISSPDYVRFCRKLPYMYRSSLRAHNVTPFSESPAQFLCPCWLAGVVSFWVRGLLSFLLGKST